jgi:hypothetical protein
MKYPECPDKRTDCRFQSEGGMTTCMYSPLEYDRDGNAVGGGMNRSTQGVRCNACGKRWSSSQTELEDAQGKPREWSLS